MTKPPSLLDEKGPTSDLTDLLCTVGDGNYEAERGEDSVRPSIIKKGKILPTDGDGVRADSKVIGTVDHNGLATTSSS